MLPIVKETDAARVLRIEDFSARPDATTSEPVNDLKIEDLSAKLDATTSEPAKPLARPLVSEATRDNELLRDLNREVFSTKPEAIVHALVKALKKAVLSAKPEATVHALVKALKREVFSTRLESRLNEAVLVTLVSQPGVTRSLADETVVSVIVVVAVLPEYCQATQYSTLRKVRPLN